MQDTLVDLIRHGEPVGGRRYRGCGVNDPLSPLGWEQMRRALGDAAPWSRVISSPMARSRELAEELAARLALPLTVEPEFREIGMGAWEGRTPEEVEASDPEQYRGFHVDPVGARPPGAEPLDAFIGRIAEAYERQIAAYPGQHLLVVCHAGVMRAVVGHLLRADAAGWYRLHIDYAGLVRVRHGRFGPSIQWVNAHTLP